MELLPSKKLAKDGQYQKPLPRPSKMLITKILSQGCRTMPASSSRGLSTTTSRSTTQSWIDESRAELIQQTTKNFSNGVRTGDPQGPGTERVRACRRRKPRATGTSVSSGTASGAQHIAHKKLAVGVHTFQIGRYYSPHTNLKRMLFDFTNSYGICFYFLRASII